MMLLQNHKRHTCMQKALPMMNSHTIPEHELIITTSRSGGPGGQHVNKADTKITVRWNVFTSSAFTQEQKERIAQKLATRLTSDGDLVVHNSSSRSQVHNKKMAIAQLTTMVIKALHVAKKRLKTKIPKGVQESRLHAKAHRSALKKNRRIRDEE